MATMMMIMIVAVIKVVNGHGASAPEIETRYASKGEKTTRRDGRENTTKQGEPEGLKPKLRQGGPPFSRDQSTFETQPRRAGATRGHDHDPTKAQKATRRDGREHTMKQNEPEGLKPKLRQGSPPFSRDQSTFERQPRLAGATRGHDHDTTKGRRAIRRDDDVTAR